MAYQKFPKFSIARSHISFLCSTLDLGLRLPSLRSIADELGISIGMVQKVLSEMESEGTLVLTKKGVQGTYLIDKDQKKLFEINQSAPLFGSVPLPYTARYEEMVNRLEKDITEYAPCYFMHTRGASARLELLLSGKVDFAIVSKFSFENIAHSNLDIAHDFGVSSYLEKHFIVTRNGETLREGMRVGVDNHSLDQMFLVDKVFNNISYRLIYTNYHSLMSSLMKKEIDVTIVNADEDRVQALEVTDIKSSIYPIEMTNAVCVVRKGDRKMKYLISHLYL